MTIQPPTDLAATIGVNRRKLLTGAAALTAAAGLTYPRHVFSQSEKGHPLAGKSIRMAILGIAGWLPSKLGVDMSPEFAKYAKARYGYDVTFSFADAPFGQLFQKAATSLATRSAEYNIIISDSQWLGALATPKWIVPLNDIIAKNKELDIEWFAPVVRQAYQTFPDGTANRYGFPRRATPSRCSSARTCWTRPARRRRSRRAITSTCPRRGRTSRSYRSRTTPSSRSSSPGRTRATTALRCSTRASTTS